MQIPYSPKFFLEQMPNSLRSASVIVPLVLSRIKVKSVIDIGCGVGTWLSIFSKHGVKEIKGIDGPWVNQEALLIPKNAFMATDLKKQLSLGRTFDLVVSLEVAEHLPPASAETFVANLTRHGSIILFSAAIPFQGGTDHLNERWQEYWADLFKKQGYVAIDYIRPLVWSDKRVSFFYAQNMLLFVKKSEIGRSKLTKELRETRQQQLSIVHPERYALIGRERKNLSHYIPRWIKKIRLALLY